MRWKLLVEFYITMFAVFLLAGDLFLPQPYRGESQKLKTSVNYLIADLFPNIPTIKIDSKTFFDSK